MKKVLCIIVLLLFIFSFDRVYADTNLEYKYYNVHVDIDNNKTMKVRLDFEILEDKSNLSYTLINKFDPRDTEIPLDNNIGDYQNVNNILKFDLKGNTPYYLEYTTDLGNGFIVEPPLVVGESALIDDSTITIRDKYNKLDVYEIDYKYNYYSEYKEGSDKVIILNKKIESEKYKVKVDFSGHKQYIKEKKQKEGQESSLFIIMWLFSEVAPIVLAAFLFNYSRNKLERDSFDHETVKKKTIVMCSLMGVACLLINPFSIIVQAIYIPFYYSTFFKNPNPKMTGDKIFMLFHSGLLSAGLFINPIAYILLYLTLNKVGEYYYNFH